MRRIAERSAFTLVELMVVVSIIAVLVAILLPAVQSAREAARVTQCQSNLRQIGLATIQHEQSLRAFPPARIMPRPSGDGSDSCGGYEVSWLVRVLPFLEEEAFYHEWRIYDVFESHPESTRKTIVSVLLCPNRHHSGNAQVESAQYEVPVLPCGCPGFRFQLSGALGDYGGNHGDGRNGTTGFDTNFYYGGNDFGVITSSRAICVEDPADQLLKPVGWIDRVRGKDIRDGMTHTILAGEKHMRLENLLQYPDDTTAYEADHLFGSARVAGPGYRIAAGPDDSITNFMSFGSWHPSGCNFVFCDGSTRRLVSETDTITLGQFAHRADGMISNDTSTN